MWKMIDVLDSSLGSAFDNPDYVRNWCIHQIGSNYLLRYPHHMQHDKSKLIGEASLRLPHSLIIGNAELGGTTQPWEVASISWTSYILVLVSLRCYDAVPLAVLLFPPFCRMCPRYCFVLNSVHVQFCVETCFILHSAVPKDLHKWHQWCPISQHRRTRPQQRNAADIHNTNHGKESCHYSASAQWSSCWRVERFESSKNGHYNWRAEPAAQCNQHKCGRYWRPGRLQCAHFQRS